ncbi:hypothetical protein CYLTODRAFT_372904 [Cylindrobasidium torrendii FP15055 ss-10]|uniref:Uncharacterized protein n=1 Tax=Cylindrobasidium torrendii FP15055 ss-10 TaxID=1314674 RepID=A0A0D7BGW4_9AGAR|nr:hypothetical protein CYLTODRAFT_372904 [Cylindrobasidium torrendii FP15055 ss-10]
MSRKAQAPPADDLPSLLWIFIPGAVLVAGYFARKWYLAHKLRTTGIGKGAPGFQTNVRRVRVTADVAARIQRGEQVSPDEIAASIARAQREDESAANSTSTSAKSPPTPPPEPENEWLPQNLSSGKKQPKRRKK